MLKVTHPLFKHQIIISNNSYARDEQGDNPGQEKTGFDGVLELRHLGASRSTAHGARVC